MELNSAPPLIIEQAKSFKLKPWTVIFVIFGLTILVELFLAFKSLTSHPAKVSNRVLPLSSATLAVVTDKPSYTVGEVVIVMVKVATGGHNTVGADLSLKYDPSVLAPLESSASANFLKSSIYTDFTTFKIDSKKGQIQVSGIVSPTGAGFNGVGVFGEMAFRALKTGQTSLSLNFAPNSTTQSTVVELASAKNILSQVKNAQININASAPKVPANTTCQVRVAQTCLDAQNRVGTYWCSAVSDGVSCQTGCFQDRMSNIPGCKVVGF